MHFVMHTTLDGLDRIWICSFGDVVRGQVIKVRGHIERLDALLEELHHLVDIDVVGEEIRCLRTLRSALADKLEILDTMVAAAREGVSQNEYHAEIMDLSE